MEPLSAGHRSDGGEGHLLGLQPKGNALWLEDIVKEVTIINNDVAEAVTSAAGSLKGLTPAAALYAAASLAACIIIRKALLSLARRALSRTRLDARLRGLITKIFGAVMWFIIALILCDMLGINITSLVALFSVAGLAFSLAIQDSLSNLAGGITLLSNRPFKLGDYVEAGGQEGTVRSIGMVYTQLATPDNRIIYIPNSMVSAGRIINYSTEGRRRVEITLSASYDDSTAAVRQAVMDAIEADGRVLSDPAPSVFIQQYGDSSISYTVRVWVKNADFWPVKNHLTEACRESFARRGVTMSYNHINVHMIND